MKDVLLAVSPLYLNAIYSQIKNYPSLVLTGASDAEELSAVVPTIPVWSICGFTYLSDYFRKVDDRWLREILYTLNIIFSGQDRTCPVVLATRESRVKRSQQKFVYRLLSGLDLSNLAIYFISSQYVSDVTINRDIFGTTLLHSRDLKLIPEQMPEPAQPRQELRFELPFRKELLDVMMPLKSLQELDKWFSLNTDKLLSQLREALYKKVPVIVEQYPSEYGVLAKAVNRLICDDGVSQQGDL